MKKIFNWRVALGMLLVLLSAVLYYFHYLVFHDSHHIFIYMVGDIAFVPIEVLMVTLIIHHLLEKRSKRVLLEKMNMLIGAFFTDTGTDLLKLFTKFDKNADELGAILKPNTEWKNKDFENSKKRIKEKDVELNYKNGDLCSIRDLLQEKKPFLMNLLANPNLLEHDTFTDLLWAVFHFSDELSRRSALTSLPVKDCKHLSGDMTRAYKILIIEWLEYMKHLKDAYPYLYSLAVRTNPFDPNAEVEVVV